MASRANQCEASGTTKQSFRIARKKKESSSSSSSSSRTNNRISKDRLDKLFRKKPESESVGGAALGRFKLRVIFEIDVYENFFYKNF